LYGGIEASLKKAFEDSSPVMKRGGQSSTFLAFDRSLFMADTFANTAQADALQVLPATGLNHSGKTSFIAIICL